MAVAIETGKLIRNIIGQATSKKDSDLSALTKSIELVGQKISQAQPIGTCSSLIKKNSLVRTWSNGSSI